MNVASLRDYLTEHIEYTFPDIPVWVAMGGYVFDIGRIWASDSHVILEAGEEEELSKRSRVSEEALLKMWGECLAIYIATNS
jgi:hypothetical protein